MDGVLTSGNKLNLNIFRLNAVIASCLVLGPPGFNSCFSFAPGISKLFGAQGSPLSGSLLNLLSPRFRFIKVVIMIYLFVLDESLTS